MMETVIGAGVGGVIGAATTLLIAAVGGINWIVRKFGEMNRALSVLKENVNNRLSSLEQRVEALEKLPGHAFAATESDASPGGTTVRGLEIRFIEEKSSE